MPEVLPDVDRREAQEKKGEQAATPKARDAGTVHQLAWMACKARPGAWRYASG